MTAALRSNAYQTMYEVLDEACVTRWPPAGSRAALHGVIDGLRSISAPRAHIDLAERVAVAFNRLECALRNHDERAEGAVRAELREAGAEWLDTPMCASIH